MIHLLVLTFLTQPVYHDEVVAVVGSKAIFLSNVKQGMTEALGSRLPVLCRTSTSMHSMSTLQMSWIETLQMLMQQAALEQAASGRSVSVSSDEVDASLKRLAHQHKKTVRRFLADMAASGFSESRLRRILRLQLLQRKLFSYRTSSLLMGRSQVASYGSWRLQKQGAVASAKVRMKVTGYGTAPEGPVTKTVLPYSVPPRVWDAIRQANPGDHISVKTDIALYEVDILEYHPAPHKDISPLVLQENLMNKRFMELTSKWTKELQKKYPVQVFRQAPPIPYLCQGR